MRRSLIPSAAALALALPLPALSQIPPAWRDASASLPAKEAPGHSMGARAADVDNDGDLDLVIAMEYRANRLLLNDGLGRFTDASDRLPRAARDSEEVALFDADRDGDLDIAVANEDDLRPELYLFDAGRWIDASARIATRVKANAIVALDVNRDGATDLFLGGDKVSVLFLGDGRGGFRDVSLTHLPDTFGGTQDVAHGDIDGDGDQDLVLGNEDRNQIYVNDGAGRFSLAPAASLARQAAPEETRDADLFDADGDGDLDLVFANVRLWNPRAVPGWRLLLNDGNGVFADASATWLPAREDDVLSALPFELDGDGRVDLVTTSRDADLRAPWEGGVRVFRNTGARFEDVSGQWLPAGLATNGFDIVPGDFDGDGRTDLYIAARGAPDVLLLSRRE